MRSVRLFFLVLVTVFLPLSACTSGQPSEQDRLQLLVEKMLQDNDLPGISVAMAKGDEDSLLATAGFADLEQKVPVQPETGFFIGSISKNLFAAVALMLVDEGLLGLDDPLSGRFDWPRADELTLRMLLNHTSGVPEYLTQERYQSNDGGIPAFFSKPRSPAEILALVRDQPSVFEPGIRQEYSNTNGLLLGQLIEKVTGRPLVAVLEERIATPLGLEHMYLYGTATTTRPRARGHSGRAWCGAAEGELVDASFADEALPDSADGSVVASARDLLRYHRALRSGELLSDPSWTAMCTVEPDLHNGLNYLVGEGPLGRYAGNLGRAMGHVAASLYYADHDTYVVVLVNRGDAPLRVGELMKEWFEHGG